MAFLRNLKQKLSIVAAETADTTSKVTAYFVLPFAYGWVTSSYIFNNQGPTYCLSPDTSTPSLSITEPNGESHILMPCTLQYERNLFALHILCIPQFTGMVLGFARGVYKAFLAPEPAVAVPPPRPRAEIVVIGQQEPENKEEKISSSSKGHNFFKPKISFKQRLEKIKFAGKIPSHFCCPIGEEIMDEPVFCRGHTYDRKNLIQWLKLRDPYLPIIIPNTNEQLPPGSRVELQVNYGIKSAIEIFVTEQEQHRKQHASKSSSGKKKKPC